ncbi:hypothetical protein PHLGIDRAFT_285573 [Phlebiopsis gigantea 11061_1 CR5-6]|uniref:Uncharacterized protein n=1 Tax=Phlebiopsis gigantea (strain 11061_1 CR5-6) TaxID=745531 RepID=A0A0C3RRE1_PHLG1|nr:hypothetical protein PHLGIDRAFT_285573 [Phlebiopsis gigantea 11061_1 CR5-6]
MFRKAAPPSTGPTTNQRRFLCTNNAGDEAQSGRCKRTSPLGSKPRTAQGHSFGARATLRDSCRCGSLLTCGSLQVVPLLPTPPANTARAACILQRPRCWPSEWMQECSVHSGGSLGVATGSLSRLNPKTSHRRTHVRKPTCRPSSVTTSPNSANGTRGEPCLEKLLQIPAMPDHRSQPTS